MYRAALSSDASHASMCAYRVTFEESLHEFEQWLADTSRTEESTTSIEKNARFDRIEG